MCWMVVLTSFSFLLHLEDGEQSGLNFKDFRGTAKNVANLATSVTKSATSATLAVTKMSASAVTKTATTATMAATKATSVGLKTAKAAANTTKNVSKLAAKTTMKVGKKATFGLFSKRKKNKEDGGSTAMSADDEYSESEDASEIGMPPSSMPIDIGKMPVVEERKKRSFVELSYLEPNDAKAAEGSVPCPQATTVSLGHMTLRGGSRNLPVSVFGGPVLCVATRSEENDEGTAHFYSRRVEDRDTKASEYVATGPTLPFPDLVVWDDDGVYCAVITHSRIAVYLSEPPEFVLVGSTRIALPSNADPRISSARFVHGVLFCSTVNSVHASKFFLKINRIIPYLV